MSVSGSTRRSTRSSRGGEAAQSVPDVELPDTWDEAEAEDEPESDEPTTPSSGSNEYFDVNEIGELLAGEGIPFAAFTEQLGLDVDDVLDLDDDDEDDDIDENAADDVSDMDVDVAATGERPVREGAVDGDDEDADEDEEDDEDGDEDDDGEDVDEDEDEADEEEEDDDDNPSIILDGGNLMVSRRAAQAIFRRIMGRHGLDDDDDEIPFRTRYARPKRFEPKVCTEPQAEGLALLNSGEFGQPTQLHTLRTDRASPRSIRTELLFREHARQGRGHVRLNSRFLPSSNGRLAVHYQSRAYSGQFSQDGSFFYTCSQDFRVRMYDTSDPSRWRHYKTVCASSGRWTITDANLSPDNKRVAYASITPFVQISRTDPDIEEEDPVVLDFRRGGGRYSFGIWSIRFSSDGREMVAGTGDHSVYVYDIDKSQVVLAVRGHADDVNAVCFADQSTNVLFSGSDDSLIKVWDRRSMVDQREAGVLAGHQEGITYIASKGDGRYVLSNGKDQTTKLWDIRKLISADRWDATNKVDYFTGFDYRHQHYPGPRVERHPQDCSVMTYTGHRILKTLIRCGFSPVSNTGQRYVFSGSDCGKVFIWNLDGTIARTLDLSRASLPSDTRRRLRRGDGGSSSCIRDVAWHPTLPVVASTSWHSEMDAGSVFLHEPFEDDGDEAPVLRNRIREPVVPHTGFW